MAKIILLAIAVWLVITVLKRYLRNTTDNSPGRSEPENMVQCAYCGIHLPTSDSFSANNQYYCCEAHSKAEHGTPPNL